MRLAAPAVLEFRPESDHQQDRNARDPIYHEVEQLARGRVDPMRILEDHQNRSAAGQGFELMQQRREQLFALALRAQIELGGGTRQ
jgi:hypothetical protein